MSFPWDDNVYIIAEAGVNHNGDLNLAKKLIEVSKETGADAVKFQTWKPGELTGKYAIKTEYMGDIEETRSELSNRLCLSYDDFFKLKEFSDEIEMEFLTTPDGFESLDFVSDELNIPYIKVGSSELNHLTFLEKVGSKNKPVILSTGLGTLDEVKNAVLSLRKNNHNLEIIVLQCTSEYPAPNEDLNLLAIKTIRETLKVKTGFSDHSLGQLAGLISVGLEACVIEKHFTIDKSMNGPDHKSSLNPKELSNFVTNIKKAKTMLGNGIKIRMPSELKNLESIRRSIVSKGNYSKGTILLSEMLTCKRPATGFDPDEIDKIVGKKLTKDINTDQPIDSSFIE